MIRYEESEEDLQLNMAPMIDMVFLLIIFFLTATTFSEKERAGAHRSQEPPSPPFRALAYQPVPHRGKALAHIPVVAA